MLLSRVTVLFQGIISLLLTFGQSQLCNCTTCSLQIIYAFSIKSCCFRQRYNSRSVACPFIYRLFSFLHSPSCSHGVSYFFDVSILFF